VKDWREDFREQHFLGVNMVARSELNGPTGIPPIPTCLRQAMAHAQSGGTMNFAPALSGWTISVTNRRISITSGITMDASDWADGVMIKGQGRNSRFHCANPSPPPRLNFRKSQPGSHAFPGSAFGSPASLFAAGPGGVSDHGAKFFIQLEHDVPAGCEVRRQAEDKPRRQ
jgi:hypothetical protein